MAITRLQTVTRTGEGDVKERNTGKILSSENSQLVRNGREHLILSFPNKKVRGKYRSGKNFAVDKDTIEILSVYLDSDFTRYQAPGLIDYRYTGDHCPSYGDNVSHWPTIRTWTDNEIDFLGTSGFSRANPTKPLGNAAEFLAELRDLPKIPILNSMRKRALGFRNLAASAGDEYLNIEFGWRPFLSDVIDATANTLLAKQHVAQFIKDSGKTVRRSRKLEVANPRTTTQDLGAGSGFPIGNVGFKTNPGKYTSVTKISSESWFVGAFTYYISPAGEKWYSPDSISRGEQILNHMYGTRVTPSLLWKLAPWSWMNSYFGNVGTVIDNFTSFDRDNLCMKYGYVMTKSVASTTYTLSGVTMLNGKKVPTTSTTLTRESKRRYVANPFGIASSQGLSAKQLAILGALGISRT